MLCLFSSDWMKELEEARAGLEVDAALFLGFSVEREKGRLI
ncbi:MAG: hypothetical protein AAGB46_11345 [Verrucomicrobiota bacterium]